MPDSYWQDEEASAVDAGIGFSVDLDEEHVYDEDLLLVIHHDVPRSVAELVAESTLEAEVSTAAIEKKCAELGIHDANAMFVYGDPTQVVTDTTKLYNGLAYIGLFAG
ncbi:immunity 22 family protein [Microbacterium sp. kSW2-24]|uniref:immunity 22 family protein n=1 Tax=Microbacterium galbinum TaxID=2851646 RepID=UPI001FFDE4F0|nr:immunity 22 family protein [Microbacterium galbinum]MCK2021917.1 immunity 22 family protein [Microbacterium galbinum]